MRSRHASSLHLGVRMARGWVCGSSSMACVTREARDVSMARAVGYLAHDSFTQLSLSRLSSGLRVGSAFVTPPLHHHHTTVPPPSPYLIKQQLACGVGIRTLFDLVRCHIEWHFPCE